MSKPPKTAIACEATPEGRIKLFVIHKGKAKGSIEMPPEGVAGVVAALLIAAMKAPPS